MTADQVTILISTSPRPTHPSPRILDQTIISIRAQLPYAPMVIMCDGVPGETEPKQALNYAGFRDAIAGRYDNAKVLTFDQHAQQSGMLEKGLAEVHTPLLLYMEDDWALHPGIEWDRLGDIIQSGWANVVRLYAYCRIHPIHMGMVKDHVLHEGLFFWRTTQWSQNPHLASSYFYRTQVLPRCLNQVDAIENIMHGPVGCSAWEDYRVVIYNPEHLGTTQVVTHLRGRETLE